MTKSNNLNSLFDSIWNLFDLCSKANQYVNNKLSPVIDYYDKNKDAIDKFLLDTLDHIQKVNQYLEKDLFDKLKIYGWVIPGTLPITIAGKLYEEIETANFDKISEQKLFDNFFVKEFSNNNWEYLTEMLSDWEKQKKINNPRLNIIKSCLTVLKTCTKKTAAQAIIPTLIAQIDGIVADKFTSRQKLKRELEQDQFQCVGIYLLCDTLFQYTKNVDKKDIKDISFCRNKILHGEYTNYGYTKNIIKLFLLIEIIVNMENNEIQNANN